MTASAASSCRRLDGQLALVTAGTAGIGLAVAERFIAEGAEVVVTGTNALRADEAARRLGDRAHVVLADAGDVSGTALTGRLRELGRPLDVAVVNAGRDIAATPIVDTTPEAFDLVAGLNFRGAFFTLLQSIPLMRNGGRIVLVSSIAGGVTRLVLQRFDDRRGLPAIARCDLVPERRFMRIDVLVHEAREPLLEVLHLGRKLKIHVCSLCERRRVGMIT
jgi:threonine dehydrogenase-like Zn-dependent dehydrogenase